MTSTSTSMPPSGSISPFSKTQSTKMMKFCSSKYLFLAIQYCGTAATILAEMYWECGGEVYRGVLECLHLLQEKHARGHLGSYTIESLVEHVRNVVADGVKKIWISIKDTEAYGRDIGVNLPILLKAIVVELPSNRSTMF
ncbi:hypothetical protein GIB67_037005 [Kingdonia uniflora]|uniref:Uncharacterized protein n=1 Tax=Kingdonia uniflora TaxID=39325 RepID=A0A7J7LHH9_9MAGN|nr:hypothetical protein GIB67_037005 [Kingdonia uniflora]